MKRKTATAIVAAFLMVTTAMPALAAQQPVVKEYTFKTSDRDFRYEENQEIEIGGEKYKATEIKYEKLSEEKRKSENREYINLTSKTVPEKITLADGTELSLEDVNFEAHTVTDVDVYRNYVSQPDIPQNLKFYANGQEVIGKRTSIKKEVSETYNMPFSINGKFYGDKDSLYYELNGRNIPANTAPEFDKFSKELLAYLDLDSDIYRIDSGQWASGYYSEGDKTVRMAKYTGMQKSVTYTATYQATLYSAEAIYSNGDTNDEPVYTVKAIVEYTPVGLSQTKIIAIGAGVLVLATAIGCIIYFLKKKKKEEQINNE